jgi:hypothetical protein
MPIYFYRGEKKHSVLTGGANKRPTDEAYRWSIASMPIPWMTMVYPDASRPRIWRYSVGYTYAGIR